LSLFLILPITTSLSKISLFFNDQRLAAAPPIFGDADLCRKSFGNLDRSFQHHRAIFNAGTATGAALGDDAAGPLSDFHSKISGRPLDTF
jgi:hypothetical protein